MLQISISSKGFYYGIFWLILKIKLCSGPASPTYWLYIDRAICKLIDPPPTDHTHTHTYTHTYTHTRTPAKEFGWDLYVCKVCIGILGQEWYLIVSIPDLCTLTYFVLRGMEAIVVTDYTKKASHKCCGLKKCLGSTCCGREKNIQHQNQFEKIYIKTA